MVRNYHRLFAKKHRNNDLRQHSSTLRSSCMIKFTLKISKKLSFIIQSIKNLNVFQKIKSVHKHDCKTVYKKKILS